MRDIWNIGLSIKKKLLNSVLSFGWKLQHEIHRKQKVFLLTTAKLICYNTLVSDADVAQLAEQLICNQQVAGSSPIVGSRVKWVGGRVVKGGRL